MRFLVAMFVITTLSACAGKSVYTPKPGAEAVGAERSVQEGLANGQKGSNEYTGQLEAPATYQAQLNRIAPKIQKAGIEVCQGIGRKNCTFDFKLEPTRELNAYADGRTIHITMGMMAFANTDDDVAVVLAHEYAHNVLAHVASTQRNATMGGLGGTIADQILKSQGLDTGGQLAQYGQQYAVMKYSKTFEAEADHVGLYIVQHAGFPYENAPNFWRRMSTAMPNAIYTGTTHPTNPERFVAMNQTITEIEVKKDTGQPVLPNMKR